MKTIIIDDNTYFLNELQTLLTTEHPDIELLDTAGTVADGSKLIEEYHEQLDFVFLDIELPDGTGFDILEALEELDLLVIFITAKNEYAERAFDFEALHYLTKPLDAGRLSNAIERAKNRTDERREYKERLRRVSANFREKKLPSRMAIKAARHTDFVEVRQIIYLQADGNLTRIWTLDKRYNPVKQLGDFARLLKDYPYMMRIHRSYVVNLNCISRIRNNGTRMLAVLNDKDQTEVSVSMTYREELLRRLEEL